ncbi:MAG: hypothetical protein HY903_03150 [Deltaproteobacteria bacterium]|nr:hypothetical protein [Deltaproteobacteria bacterium]
MTGTGAVDEVNGGEHLVQRIRITGSGFGGATVKLTQDGGAEVPLLACSTSDTLIEVQLPATGVMPGRHVLSVANQAGACSQDIYLLQGVKGDPGSLSVSMPTFVGELNAATAADPTLRLRGTLSGMVSTFMVTADSTGTAGRHIKVDGADAVAGGSGGVYAVVFDLVTHTIKQTLTHEYANTAQDGAALRVLLMSLLDTDLLILASAGASSQLWNATGVLADLIGFGLDPNATAVGVNDAIVFVGRLGLMPGAGLSLRATSGPVTISAVAIDKTLLGVGQTLMPPYGAAAKTVCEGNDPRLFDARPPTAGSANYIQNEPSGTQAANFNIDGSGQVRSLTVTTTAAVSNLTLSGGAGNVPHSCTWHTVAAATDANGYLAASCPASTFPISGGCDLNSASGSLLASYPTKPAYAYVTDGSSFNSANSWLCVYSGVVNATAYALCCAQ